MKKIFLPTILITPMLIISQHGFAQNLPVTVVKQVPIVMSQSCQQAFANINPSFKIETTNDTNTNTIRKIHFSSATNSDVITQAGQSSKFDKNGGKLAITSILKDSTSQNDQAIAGFGIASDNDVADDGYFFDTHNYIHHNDAVVSAGETTGVVVADTSYCKSGNDDGSVNVEIVPGSGKLTFNCACRQSS